MTYFLFKILPIFIFTISISIALNWFIIKFASKVKAVSKSDFRRKKKRRTALLGGIPLYISLWASFFIFNIQSLLIVLISAIPLILMGILDDIKEQRASVKSIAHFIAIALWIYLVPNSSLLLIKLGAPLIPSYLLLGFWILGIINAVNMIDGMDSEASSYALTASIFFIFLSQSPIPPLELITFISACMGFLIFNKPPARLYLGDSGSTFLGFFLATYAISFPYQNLSYYSLLVPLFILALPESDALLAIFRRLKSKSSISEGDHDHIHHKLLKAGFSIKQSLVILIGVSVYCGLTALLIHQLIVTTHILLVSFLSITGLCSVLGCLYLLEFKKAQQVSNYSRSLIEQSFKLSKSLNVNSLDFRLGVFDLMPYYKELQQRGIVSIQDFIQDFSEFIDENYKTKQLKQTGSYSLLVIESPKQDIINNDEQIIKSFYRLLAKHDIQKNQGKLPWGMNMFSNEKFGDQILKKFDLPISNEKKLSYNKVG